MYEAFFKLHGRPFLAAPQPTRYFPAAVIENARQTLYRSIDRGEGPGLIIGPAGTGKTLLCQMLAEEFEERFGIALLASGRISTRQALLQAILYELDLPYRGLDEGELRLSLLDYLEPKPAGRSGLLLVLDEAHTLPWRLLEEVRMLTNVVRDGQSRVLVVLAGGPTLEERFASPNLSSFAQRLAARCYLESFDSAETAQYVRAQIQAVGGEPNSLFDDDALRSVYRATDGVPRLVNQICDHAMILASLGGLRRLTSEAVDEAWADLQQLPAPWAGVQAEAQASQIVEFGNLEETIDETPSAIPFRAPAPRPMQPSKPDEQLEIIADQLSKIDDSFQPAGSIGTEVEIDFPEFGDPFGEQFAEEEVVLDRYKSHDDALSRAPRVSSWEGRQLGSLLEPMDLADPRKTQPNVPVDLADKTLEPSDIPASGASTLPIEPATAPHASSVADVPLAAVRVESPAAMERAGGNQADLIVVEDEPSAETATAGSSSAEKLEYRKLFAKIRRS